MKVEFVCDTCHTINKSQLGTPGFIPYTEYRFTSFSAAWIHVKDNPDHYVDIIVESDGESDD